MESKHYTPEIEEFHVGFEYEVFQKAPEMPEGEWLSFMPIETEDKWYKLTYPDSFLGYNLDKIFRTYKDIRVKYLDKEDIESLGFKPESYIPNCFTEDDEGQKGWILTLSETDEIFLHVTEDREVFIGQQHVYSEVTGNWTFFPLFNGTIKNKSEFKKLLKQLNIPYEEKP